jgi:glycerol kinase
MPHLIAIDQGTTSTRAMVFDASLAPVASASQELRQIYPAPGEVEHDPEEIWAAVVATVRAAMAKANVAASDVAALGIANQRETAIVWDRATGKPIHNAIVWQDRRTADACARHRRDGHEAMVAAKTGLLLDPYFSATKIAWLLDRVDGARAAARAGRLAFGTVDTFLLWRLTGGAVHATDVTNASRTMLFDIRRGRWDEELASMFRIPPSMLPSLRDNADDFGSSGSALFGGAIRILGMAGDQQAATIGQGCFFPGMMKATYGTGCFALLNTGAEPVFSRHRLLTTIAYQIDGNKVFALEGAIFVAGAAVQWLRDGLHLIAQAADVNALAQQANPAERVYLVPAFVGLGAPHWDAHARGAIYGLTRNSGAAELAKAALESVGYQTRELLEAMRADWPALADTVLRVDGGMTGSDLTMQFLADILGAPVDLPGISETTALGAAYLAGYKAGVCPDPQGFAATWRRERRFTPRLSMTERHEKWAGWQDAVRRTRTAVGP